MPDFDKQLNPIIKEEVKQPLDLTSRAPVPYSPSFTSDPSVGTDQPNVFDKLNFATRNSNPVEKGIFITNKELSENKRYSTFNPTIEDYEDFAGYGQSSVDQLANGIVKMAGTLVGTFLQGFATIPNTIAAFKNGKAADLSGGPNSYEAAIDSWTKNLEDEFPNYYTQREREHPFLSAVPFSGGFSNFWGDKVIKNIGFTAGAISSAIVQDFAVGMVTEGIGEIPLIGAQIGKASLYLNKLFSAETKVGRALGATGKSDISILLEQASKEGVTGAKLLDLKKLQQIGEYTKLTTGFRYGMSLYGSARTEAAVEARDGYNQVKSELIKQFKEDPLNNGAEPFGKDLEDIEDAATNAMNTRFGINMAILTVSNAIQFDNLFKSFTSASKKGVTSSLTRDFEEAGKIGLKEKSLDVFEKKVTTGLPNKVWDFVKPKLTNAFTEGVFEEGGQYAAERGTLDYYTRRYNQKKNTDPKKAKHWDTLNEIANSTVTGLTDQFGSKDGIENMFIGALSALVTGAGMKAIDRVKGSSSEKRLQSSINILNQYGLTGILANQYKDTVNSLGIAADMEEAVKDKNVFKYKNLKHDMFFNFVNSRLGNDMHDVTIEQLNMLKDLPKEEFEKHFGMDFSDSNKTTVAGYVDALISKANGIKRSSDVINNTFKNPFKKSLNPKTEAEKVEADKHDKFNEWKTELKYQTSRSEDTKDRLSSIQQRVSKINPLVGNSLLATLTNQKSLKELSKSYEKEATEIGATIDTLPTPEEKKKAKEKIKTLRSLSEKINIAINSKAPDLKTFSQVLNFELNNQDQTQDDVISPEYLVDLHEFGNDVNKLRERKAIALKAYEILSSKEGFENYYALDEEEEEKPAPKPTTATTAVVTPTTTHTFVNKAGDKEIAQIGKEYEMPSSKVAKISKIDDDRWQVTAPNGDITFHSTEEKAKEEADELNQDVADLTKVKVIALNPDGTFKVEDLAGNIQNISADRLQGYERLKTEQEKLEKDKEQILNQQSEIVKDSGNVGTNNPANDKDVPEGKIPDADILFISGTSESEKEGYYVDENGNIKDPTQAAINLRNQREFLNNAGGFKNRANMRAILVTPALAKAYGLNGLVQISYGKNLDFDINTIPKIDDVDLGFVAQVFVEQVGDKLFFVDKEGNQLGEFGKQLDEETLRKVIFQTMRTTKLTYNDNVTPRYRKDQKEEAEAYAEAWKRSRATIFATDPSASPTIYKFQISRGIAEKGDVNNHVAGTLIDEKNEAKVLANDQSLIQIPTAGVVAHHTGQINMPNGRPVIVYQDNVEFLNNIRLKGKRALAVYEAIKQIADEITEQSKAGKKILVNKKLSRFLQNVLYWKEGKTQPETNQINIAEDGTSISFAGNKYAIPEIGERKDDIIEAIEKAFHNTNNKTLSPEMFSKTFLEYYVDDNGKLSEDPREWTNYQTYLLSSTYPDGSARSIEDTPLSTKIKQPTDEIPYTHKQKYSTLIGLELPVGVIAKPAAAVVTKATEKINTQFGEIPFSLDENGEPEFDETDKTFLATRKKIIDAINNLKVKNGQPKASEQELLGQANGTITALVTQELQKPKPTEVKETRKFNYKGQPNTIPTKFGDIVFSIDEDGDPVIDENNPSNKGTIQKLTAAISKMKPDASKAEISNTVDATMNTLIQNELVKDVPAPAAPVSTDLQNERQKAVQKLFKGFNVRSIGSSANVERSDSEGSFIVSESEVKGDTIILKLLHKGTEKYSTVVVDFDQRILSTTSEKGKTYKNDGDAVIEFGSTLREGLEKIQAKYNEDLAALEQPVVSDIEAKKAEIEKLKQTPEGKEIENRRSLTTVSDEAADENNYDGYYENRVSPEGSDEFVKTGEWIGTYINKAGEKEEVVANSEKELLDALNAKYDAELAALEGKPVTPTVSTSTVEEQRAEAIAKIYKFYNEAYQMQKELAERGRKLDPDNDLSYVSVLKDPIAYLQKDISNFKLSVASTIERLENLKKSREELIANKDKITYKEDFEKQLKDIDDKIKSDETFVKDYTKAIAENEQLVKDINALQGTTSTEAPKEPGSFNVNNVKKRGNMFRKVGVLSKIDRMTDADFNAFKEWHAEKLPTIPFEVLENMININSTEKAWGVFENGVAKFVKGGLRGTEYHEVGEAIWNGMLTPEEQDAILADERKRPGQFTDRETRKKYNYDDPTVSDQMLKERILDDFSDFRVGKLPATSLGQKIVNFFRRLLEFFKQFIMRPSMKEQLFKAIEAGEFKDRQLSPTSKSMPPQYRAAGHLTEEETNAYVKDMTAIASAIILGNGKIGSIDKSAIYNLRSLTSDDVFKKVEEVYIELDVRQELGDVAWKELVTKTKQELKVLLKVDFNEEDLININEGETNRNDYAREPFSTDYKKSAPVGIKFVSATLIDRVPTNQENSTSFKLPDAKVNPKTQTYSLLGYGRVFSTMLDKLKNTTSIGKAISKIINLANEDANYVSMFQRLGGNLETKTINFKDFKFEDWRLFIEMLQIYTKQKPNAIVQYISQGQVYSGSALVTGIVNVTTKSWIQNMRNLAKDPDSIIGYNSDTKIYSIGDLSEIPTDNPQQKVSFLSELGVIFPLEAFNKLKEEQQITFTLTVANIKEYLQKTKEIMSVKKRTLDVAGQYNTLAELLVSVTHPDMDNTRINLDGKQSNSFADNNAPSVFENEFNEVETLDELFIVRPELQDVYSKGAQLLKKGGMFFDKEGNRTSLKLKVGYIEGTKNKDDNKGVTSVKLNLGDRFTQEINQNVLGQYYIMVPADSSTEWMMNMGNHVSFEDVEQGKDGWKQINKIFRGYLIDDVALALDADNRKQLKNVGNLERIAEIESRLETLKAITDKSNDQKEEVKKLNVELEKLKKKPKELRFFKDILSEKTLSAINQMIIGGSTQIEIEKFIDENIDDVNASIKQFIDGTVQETRDILVQNGQIEFVNRDKSTGVDYYKYPHLTDNFTKKEGINKNKLVESDILNILTFANANYIINNIEFHKILFGDPYQFLIKEDGTLDATKRFKSFLSPRRTTIDSPELNTFLDDEMNKVGDVDLQPGDPGYHKFKAWIDTVTVSDVKIIGSIATMKNVPKEIRNSFAKSNEADGASIMLDGTYRELKIKNGQWNIFGPEEAWHQWQMAYTRQNLPGYEYTNKALEAHDKALMKTKEPKHTIEVLKPIVSGAKSGSNNINLVLDKFSQMPLYYSMAKGTNLEKLYMKMLKEKKGYIIMLSGRKVGAEALHDLYTSKGEFNDAAFNNNIEVSWKSYGIQVENTYEGDKEQTRGSQFTKIATLDLYENGEPIGETPERKAVIANEVKRNKEILDRLHKNGYERFLKRLGIEDLGGSYEIKDKRRLAKTLQDEMFRRELSDNVKDSIQLDENGEFIIPFEASPAYLQIKSILYSFVDKEITSPKMHGGSYVQTPVTLWENAKAGRKIAIKTEDGYKHITRQEYDKYTDEQKKKVILTDDTLKFYIDEDGNRYSEIMLPHWFKTKLGKHANKSDKELIQFLNTTKEGRELLSGLGFRIPTDGLNKIEAYRVKGFLPQYMGKTVVVPSEITTKAGSDFDIDKLNMYLKSIYIDKYGEIRIIRLKGTEEATRSFYGDVFEEKLARKRANKLELLDTVDALIDSEEVSDEMLDKYGDYIDELFTSGIYSADAMMDMREKIQQAFDKLTDDQVQNALKENFMDNMYRRALENEYYDSLEKLVTLPENFERLIFPTTDDGLKDVADKLDRLRGYDENKIKNRLLNRNFMTSLRHAFVTAKRWVGIAAVNITGHSLTQKFQAYIDPERFNNVPLADRKILKYGNGEILLDHNKLTKNGKSYISLSGRLDTIGKFISDGLSGFVTAFVDVAKDPYILKIIKSDLVVGTFMFLRRVGVPKEQLAMFMNQPIIDEYLTMLDNKGVKSLFDSRYISAIQMKFPTTVTQLDLEGFNKEELADNIENYYANGKKLGDYKNHEQQNIFQEFLKYAKMAEYNFKFTQASNYDTTKFQSGDSLQLKQWRTEAAQEKNIISSVKELLESNFIGLQAEYLDKSMDALGEVLVLETPEFTDVTNEVLKSYEQDMFLSKDKFDRIANKIKASFLDYIIQKRSDVAANLKKQLVDDKDSVAQMLIKAKRDFPGVKLLEDLEVDSSGRVGGAQTIKLRVNDKIAYNENMYQGMMRELRDDPKTNALYKGIVKVAILQGTYQSAISIKNIIPVEDYSAHITPILAGLGVDDEIRAFAKSNEFQRNEWQDNDIVPIVEPRFAKETQTQAEEDAGLPRRFQGLYKVVGMGKNRRKVPGPFPTIKKLGAITNKRDLLFINSKYQAKVSNYDVVKVPRTIPIDKENAEEGKIDVATGLEITNQTYADHIKRGDLSLRNYYGYQKVKYADGSPLVAYYDLEGNPVYVYKFINLHGDGMYASEYYGDGRPSVFSNGSQKNVKKIEGTTVSNEISDQAIIDYYGGQSVPQEEADPIIATIEKESQTINMNKPVPGVENIPNSGLTIEQSNQFINLLQPQIANQAYIENKAKTANMMFSFGLRWAKNIPNETEKSEQAKNLGQPRPNRKAIKSKEGMTYGYYLTDQNNNPLPSIKELQPIMDFIQSKLGIDMSNYDAMLGNIYDQTSFISQHRDTTESVTAKNYPVIVLNLGANGHLEFDRDTSSNYATYKKSGQLDLTNGGIYAFGVNGDSRFTFHHRIGSGLESANPLKPITLPNGQTLTNYRITLTFRRASDLEPGMPTSPNISSKTVAIIGTAGRNKVPTLQEWNSMLRDAESRVNPSDILISGGAAFADHIAVKLFLEGKVKGLKLRLPASIKNNKFLGGYKTAGSTANYYHEAFSKVIGVDTVAEIQQAIDKGADVTYETETSNKAMFARNAKVAAESNAMIAYTYGEENEPADGGTKDTWDSAKYTDKTHVSISKIKPTQPTVEVGKKELFSAEKGIAEKSFRGKPLNFVDKIPTQRDTIMAMSNNRQTGIITIDQKAMEQKFIDKAWTKPAKQLDGSFATPLDENEFGSFDEWFTFALIHESKHDTILKQEGETIGQYEDRINEAALEDLRENYDVGIKDEGSIVYDPEEDRVGMTVGSDEKGYVNVTFDGDNKVYTFKRDALELSDAFSLRDASRFNTIELEIGNIIEVDSAKLRLLSVDETDYEDLKFLKLQSRSGLIVPAIMEYNEETGESEIRSSPAAWELGLDEDEYNTEDFKC